jgi:hypothetical protein
MHSSQIFVLAVQDRGGNDAGCAAEIVADASPFRWLGELTLMT